MESGIGCLTFTKNSTQNYHSTQYSMARTSKISKKPSLKPAKTLPAKKAANAKSAKPSPAQNDDGDFQEVRSLIELLKKNDLAVLEFAKGDFKITLKTPAGTSGGAPLFQAPATVATAAPVSVTAALPDKTNTAEPAKTPHKEIKSPMVGTFYSSPSPESPLFVEVGKTITAESVVCIIEAMKVMNEIQAEISGKVVEIVAENGKPVEFGEVLFRVS